MSETSPERAALDALGSVDRLLGTDEQVQVKGMTVAVRSHGTDIQRIFDFATDCLIVAPLYVNRESGITAVPFGQLSPRIQALAEVLRPLVETGPVEPLVDARLDRTREAEASARRFPAPSPLPVPRR